MKNISILTRDKRIHQLIVSTKFINNSVLPFGAGVITDQELFEIFSKIEHRIYHITELPRFEMMEDGNRLSVSCASISSNSKEELIDIFISNTKNKYFIFYHIDRIELVTPTFLTKYAYSIRGSYHDDRIFTRNKKINEILDEE